MHCSNVSSGCAEILWRQVYKESHKPYIMGTVYSLPHPNIISFPDPLTESIINIPNLNKTAIYILADVHCDYGDFTITETQFLAGM